jgi:predicted restriction endonuclease
MKCSYAGAVVAVAAPAPSVVETQIEAMQKKLDIYEKERIDQKTLVESMQQKFDVQQKSIESMQQKIDLITILLQNGAGREATSSNDSQCLITEPQKSRDKRKKISKDMRQHIVNKQENTCGICKLVLTPYFEMDHIIGLQFGGTDDEANLMALCRDCHAKKSITENQRRDKIKDAIQIILRE